jgi:hypothetical protein
LQHAYGDAVDVADVASLGLIHGPKAGYQDEPWFRLFRETTSVRTTSVMRSTRALGLIRPERSSSASP